MSKIKKKTITVEYPTWKRLAQWKLKLDCTFDELIDRILKIVPASELKGEGK